MRIRHLYSQGTIPDDAELEGEFYVVVPWFPWFSLAPLKHRKAFGDGGRGCNLLLKRFAFGRFELKRTEDSLLIDYDQKENSPVIRRVIDRV